MGADDSRRHPTHRKRSCRLAHGAPVPALSVAEGTPRAARRIAVATLFVVLAKAVVLTLPFAYAGAVDAMAADGDRRCGSRWRW
jgi:hypothetical protein